MTRSRIVFFVLSAMLACSAACSKRGEQPAPPPAKAPPAANQPVSVVRIDLGNGLNADKSVAMSSESFKPTDTIYASIETAGSAPNATLAIQWTYENGQLVSESSQTIAPTGPAHTEFHISKPDGWPAGNYTASVTLNGGPAAMKTFRVN